MPEEKKYKKIMPDYKNNKDSDRDMRSNFDNTDSAAARAIDMVKRIDVSYEAMARRAKKK